MDNITSIGSTNCSAPVSLGLASSVTAWVVLAIGLPLILLAIFVLYFLVQADHVAPVYVINLLISDLMQMGSKPFLLQEDTGGASSLLGSLIYYFGLMASVGFMLCIALERYLVIAFPLWYRCRRNVKLSLVVSSVVWTVPFLQVLLFLSTPSPDASLLLLAALLLLPFPPLVFFLVGIVKALSGSMSVHPVERHRILGTLAVVVVNYAVLYLPLTIQYLVSGITGCHEAELGSILVQFSPLVDLVLYVFMRRGTKDTLLAFPCLDRGGDQRTTVTETTAADSSV